MPKPTTGYRTVSCIVVSCIQCGRDYCDDGTVYFENLEQAHETISNGELEPAWWIVDHQRH